MNEKNEVCVGFDVGKHTHQACAVSRVTGEILFNVSLENREEAIDLILTKVGPHALVVVDQINNIGSLVVKRARLANMNVEYLPGLAMKRARDMFCGIAKTDKLDAEVIARTAIGMPHTLRPVAQFSQTDEDVRLLSSQSKYYTKSITQAKNRIRATLLEADPEFESMINLQLKWHIGVLSAFGDANGIIVAGKRAYRNIVIKKYKANIEEADKLWDSAFKSSKSDNTPSFARSSIVKMLASKILDELRMVDNLESQIKDLLKDHHVYSCLLTIPGIGHKSASILVALIDITQFSSHDQLASYTGLAPKNRQSGSSINSVCSAKTGNKELKNLLIFSCTSLIGTKNYYGQYYAACKERGMAHGMALKAVARKRLKVIFAVMRDACPYVQA